MADPVFIEEATPEATVCVTVAYRSAGDAPYMFIAPVSQAVTLLSIHAFRDMSVRETQVVKAYNGLLSFDLDQIASVSIKAGNAEVQKQVLTVYEQMNS